MVELSQLNPLSSVGIGSLGWALLIFAIALVVVGLIGAGVWWWVRRKRLKWTIPLYKKVGNKVIRIATFKAMDFRVGRAGDKLWYVPKAKKYIPVGTLQTAPNEYSHFEREDGEWINVDFPDIDASMKKIGVKYVQQDMRSQRIAINNILETRFKDQKSWWEKYGHLITHLIFYLVVCIALIVIFWQWSDIIDRTSTLLDKVIGYEDNCRIAGEQGIVPAIIMLLGGLKWWK